MKEIFQEYGGILITVVAILSIILVVTAVIGSDATGVATTGSTFGSSIAATGAGVLAPVRFESIKSK